MNGSIDALCVCVWTEAYCSGSDCNDDGGGGGPRGGERCVRVREAV